MANNALAVLESALRARKLDRTLTTALPPLDRTDPSSLLATGLSPLDACLRGGLPRGQLSEIAGPRSSGRFTLLMHLMAAAARRGEIAAFVDTFDRFDVASAMAAGIDLDRLLWIRGAAITRPSMNGSELLTRTLDRAIKALNLVLQAGGFGLVAIDLADVPGPTLRRLPFTTWLRIQRVVEGRDTACVLVTPEPLSRSAGGLTLMLDSQTVWTGSPERPRVAGADVRLRVVSPRRRVGGEVAMPAAAAELLGHPVAAGQPVAAGL